MYVAQLSSSPAPQPAASLLSCNNFDNSCTLYNDTRLLPTTRNTTNLCTCTIATQNIVRVYYCGTGIFRHSTNSHPVPDPIRRNDVLGGNLRAQRRTTVHIKRLTISQHKPRNLILAVIAWIMILVNSPKSPHSKQHEDECWVQMFKLIYR